MLGRAGLTVAFLLLGLFSSVAHAQQDRTITIGSKSFTESVLLGELAAGLLNAPGSKAEHRKQLGGTRILWSALQRGEIDVYPEYSGTIAREIFAGKQPGSLADIRRELASQGIGMTEPLGFNNTYAIAMKPRRASDLGIATISDLARHPSLRLGFSNEFMDRGDGWPALKQAYALPHNNVRGLDHDLAYRALKGGDLDAIDVYSTDAEISYYGLQLLTDDRSYFPAYDAVFLYRLELEKSDPGAIRSLRRLEGSIDANRMSALNRAVKIGKQAEPVVAAGFLRERFDLYASVAVDSMLSRLMQRTAEHLALVGLSLLAAILVAIPVGLYAARRPRLGQVLLGMTGIAQTIPGLALLVLMIPLFGIGAEPAIAALFLYSLLPIVRNTHAGIVGISLSLSESAQALGLSRAGRLVHIELPLAMPSVLAGIKTAAVINIGTATLGALIGAGGYGQPILTGIRLDDMGLILEGAVPAAALALLAQGAFELGERLFLPRPLRSQRPT